MTANELGGGGDDKVGAVLNGRFWGVKRANNLKQTFFKNKTGYGGGGLKQQNNDSTSKKKGVKWIIIPKTKQIKNHRMRGGGHKDNFEDPRKMGPRKVLSTMRTVSLLI